jgi:DNA-binding IclR family transcriptional regulator
VRAELAAGPAVVVVAATNAGTRSVVRALDILTLLSGAAGPMQLGEVSRAVGIPKSSTLQLMRALTARGFATSDANGGYALGVATFSVGAAYLRTMTPVRSVELELKTLTRILGVTSHFAVLDGDEVLYLAKNDPPDSAFGLASALGARLPAVATAVGKAQIAHRWDATRISAIGGSFAADIAKVWERGFAVDDGETAAGIRCVAAPVFDSTGCCGAVGISELLQPEKSDGEIAAYVRAAATRATERLGGHDPATPT